MPLFYVTVTKMVTHQAIIEVKAYDESEAEDFALDIAEEGGVDWEEADEDAVQIYAVEPESWHG